MIRILGGGPAGSIAALSALREGAAVSIAERSKFPRHKVCGEFVSPGIAPVLDGLGVWGRFAAQQPAVVRDLALYVGERHKRERLPEPAYGVSRYALDDLLWRAALEEGAVATEDPAVPRIIACGRAHAGVPRGGRLFGFKAHFEGPADDAVELYFFNGVYVGLNCVENGRTNVCGLGPEDVLRERRFDVDSLLWKHLPLRERLLPLRRTMKWMFTGPLEFGQRWRRRDAFYAGDALSFVDPFTGSGILCAARAGELAGRFAVRNESIDAYVAAVRGVLEKPFLFSSALRRLAASPWAEHLLRWAPGRLLFRLTRPR